MAKYTFKSIMVSLVEIDRPGISEQKHDNKENQRMEFDVDSIAEHTLTMTMGDYFQKQALFINFFLAIMIVAPIFALILALAILVCNVNFADPGTLYYKMTFGIAFLVTFISLWLLLTARASVKIKKYQTVQNERGKGNWKLIDDDKWDKFYKMLQLAQKMDR